VSTKRRKKGHGAGGGGGGHGGGDSRWLVTYADLLTVLMVLFLVLWTISSIDLKKFEKFKSGLGDFGNPAAAQASGESGGGAGATAGEGATTTTALVAPDETTTTVAPGDGPPPTLTNAQLAAVAAAIENALAAAGFTSGSGVKLEKRGLVVSVSTDGVLFDSGRAELTDAGRVVIAAIAPSLGVIANHVVIEGHTDSRPITGRAGYDNWQLSADRAVSVLKLLQNDFGMSADRLAATGYGEYQPLDASGSPEALAKNRRVEIVVLSAEAEAAASNALADSDESTDTTATTPTT
jgi:chemotaxis protein MotB